MSLFYERDNDERRLELACDLLTMHFHVKVSWVIDGRVPIKLAPTAAAKDVVWLTN